MWNPNELVMKTIKTDMQANGRFALVVGRFNSAIVDQLVAGAHDILLRHGASDDNIVRVDVPGAFEIPQAAHKLAASGSYQAVIALGCVVRGATPHFDYVAGQCASGITSAALQTGCPIAFGVITTDTLEQAWERAGTKAGNKGVDAALAAIEMANLYAALDASK